MATLFPSIGSTTVKKNKFDPFDDCVATQRQHHKKAASPYSKGRSKSLTTVVLKNVPSTIPKGVLREHLRKEEHVKELAFRRIMSSDEVRLMVLQARPFKQ